MRFFVRFMIVLAIAVALGVGLYYAVQALPDDAPRFDPGTIRIEPASDQPNPDFRPERAEGGQGRDRGLSLRGFVGVAGKTVMFSVITFVAVVIAKLLKSKPAKTQAPGS